MTLKINLSPEAVAALNAEPAMDTILKADGATKIKRPPKPLPLMLQRVIRQQVLKAFYGPLMKPTFREQLLHFSSLNAVKAVWAATHFQKMRRA